VVGEGGIGLARSAYADFDLKSWSDWGYGAGFKAWLWPAYLNLIDLN
jgi:hypothetical protein